jgi:hypothetical protein
MLVMLSTNAGFGPGTRLQDRRKFIFQPVRMAVELGDALVWLCKQTPVCDGLVRGDSVLRSIRQNCLELASAIPRCSKLAQHIIESLLQVNMAHQATKRQPEPDDRLCQLRADANQDRLRLK